MNYLNQALSIAPALVIYLLDISKSMGKPMTRDSSRMKVVSDSLRNTATEMVQRSLKQGKIASRYKVAIIAYSDEVWDIFNGIIPIDVLAQRGIPVLNIQNRTNPAMGFKYVKNLIEDEIRTWSSEYQKTTPAPLVVHMTDGELNEISEDPVPIVKEIQSIKVEDGNVLVENIHISKNVKVDGPIESWGGYYFNQDLGDPYANKLLACSSPLPESYRPVINSHQGLNLQKGVAMMFPGVTPKFVREAFVMNGVTGTVKEDFYIDESQWDEE